MRNFPVFTTQYGVASLILKEVPYRQTAYIKLLDSLEPERLLEECKDFCRVVGAEHIYASGHAVLETYPLHTAVWRMESVQLCLPETAAQAVPVTQQTLSQWKDIYNQKMAAVPNASYMDDADGKELLAGGGGYFVYRGEELLGIGKAQADTIDAVAAVLPGAGGEVVAALCKILQTQHISLQVASENTRAVRLYKRLGFVKTEEVSQWYQIL